MKKIFLSFKIFLLLATVLFFINFSWAQGRGGESEDFNFTITSPSFQSVVSGQTLLKAKINMYIPLFYEVDFKFVLRRNGEETDIILGEKHNDSLTGGVYWEKNIDTRDYMNGEYVLVAYLRYLNHVFQSEPITFIIENNDSQEDDQEENNFNGNENGEDSIFENNFQNNESNENEDQNNNFSDDQSSEENQEVVFDKTVNIIIPENNSILSGQAIFKSKINVPQDKVTFSKFILTKGENRRNLTAEYSGVFNNESYWEASLDTKSLPNGNYMLRSVFLVMGDIYRSDPVFLTVANSAEELNLTFKPIGFKSGDTVKGNKKFIVRLNREVDSLVFSLYKEGVLKGSVLASYVPKANYWEKDIDTTKYSDGMYTFIFTAFKNGKSYEGQNPLTLTIKNKTDNQSKDKKSKSENYDADKEKKQSSDKVPLNIKSDFPILSVELLPKKIQKIKIPKKDSSKNNLQNIPKIQPSAQKNRKSPQKIEILNLNLLKEVNDDFEIMVKSGDNLKALKAVFKNLENGKSYIFPAQEEKTNDYWRLKIKIENMELGNYEFFVQGIENNNIVKSKTERLIIISKKEKKRETLTENISNISSLCLERGITSFKECDEFLNLDEKCQNNNIVTQEECQRFLFVYSLPLVCQRAGVKSDVNCRRIIQKIDLPQLCKDEGVLEKERCEFFLKQKAKKEVTGKVINSGKNLKQPVSQECLFNNIRNSKICQKFLEQKAIDPNCQKARIFNKEKCKKYLRSKYIKPECQAEGIIREEDCQEYLFKKYAPLINCNKIDKWQCKNIIQKQHIEKIVIKSKASLKIKSKIVSNKDKIVKIKDLNQSLREFNLAAPLKEEKESIKIIESHEEAFLTESGELLQTLPAIIMIDSDKDGLSDDMELNMGTDPLNPDTDGDGYEDGVEVENGYSPLISANDLSLDESASVENLLNKISPLERAIINKKIIEQPKISGKISSKLSVEKISDLKKGKENKVKGYKIFGKGIPGEFVSLYIYSDLPMVVVTKVDQYGNWEYELEKTLTEGEHDVYVVINDNTGKVVSKSRPFSFFIKEAKAISASDYVSSLIEDGEFSGPQEEKIKFYYILIVVGIIITGIILFIIFIKQKEKEKDFKDNFLE